MTEEQQQQQFIDELKRKDQARKREQRKLKVFDVIWVMFLHLTITDFSWIWVTFLFLMFPWWWMITNWSEKKMIAFKYRKDIQAIKEISKDQL